MKRLWAAATIVSVLVIIYALSVLYEYVSVSGEPVVISGKPRRIVSISPNLTEIVFALGLGEKVVGVSANCNYPAEAAEKPDMGTFWQPNTETIIAARPDLVVTEQFEQHRTAAATLKRAGIHTVSVRVESVAGLFAAIKTIAAAGGCIERGQRLVNELTEQLNAVREKYRSAQKVRVLWAVETEPLRVAGTKTFINELIGLVGGENAIGATVDQYPSITTEEILACGAEVIIQSAMAGDDIPKQQEAAEEFWSRFAGLPAVKDRRIFVIQADTVLRLGPRIAAGAEAIGRCLHPGLSGLPQEPNQTGT